MNDLPTLDPREHPTRERVHFPGTPGYSTVARLDDQADSLKRATGTLPGDMAEAGEPEAVVVEAPMEGPALRVEIGQPTVSLADDEQGQAEPAARKRRQRPAEPKES